MSIGVMLFCPFTGKPRHPLDIQSDPKGILVWDGEEPLRAYIPPAQRTWVGLTDDDVMELFTNLVVLKRDYKDPVDAFKAICFASDAKLKEKNT